VARASERLESPIHGWSRHVDTLRARDQRHLSANCEKSSNSWRDSVGYTSKSVPA